MESKINLLNRKDLSLHGITKVFTINQDVVQILVDNSVLTVSGENMEVKKLDVQNGELQIAGKINSLKFTDKKEKVGLFKRIFK